MQADELTDLLSSDFEDSAELVPDERYGYDRVVPRRDIVDEMEETYTEAIRKAEDDWREPFAEMMRAESNYEAKASDPSDPNSVITIPITKRICNQQMAWLSNAILTKSPIVTIKPIDDGSYQIPTAVDPTSGAIQMDNVPAADAAKLYEAFLDYKLNERLDFGQLIDDTLYSLHVGENPTYWKTTYDPRERTVKQKKYVKLSETDNVVKILGFEDMKVPDGESVKITHVFGGNILMPIEETDIQRSPWIAEKTPMTTLELWKEFKDRKIDFALSEDQKIPLADVAEVLGFTTDDRNDTKMSFEEIDSHVASHPEKKHDIRTLWLFYPIKRKVTAQNQNTGESKDMTVIEIRSLGGKFHYPAKRLLSLYVNPYPDRPYEPFFLKKRPHRFSGTSPAQDLAPYQRLISQIFHLQIQNGVQQNVKVFLVRENSVTWRYLKNPNNKFRPGMLIPFGDPSDVKAEQLGAAVQSMAPEINYLEGGAQKLTVVSDFDLGAQIPGRTPASTVAQVEQLAKMQPQAILRSIRRPLAKAMRRYLQTVAQYSQYETIPFLDPKAQARMSKLIGFPREILDQHFSFEITATGDEDTVAARVERGSMALKETNVENESCLKLLPLIMDPHVPDVAREPAIRLLIRLEAVYGDFLSAIRPDAAKHIFTEEDIRKWAAAMPYQPPQPPPPPPPPEPRISIGLTGPMAPDMVAGVAEMAGIKPVQPTMLGASHGIQLSPAGPGPEGAPPQPGTSPPGQPPNQPGNPGMAPAGP